ncbi:Cutinase gene palindrome-binding [Gossypium arboreum]|uniref:Cutinase gene palindrome-binding n=1 Tax=Gossypium arboreum TaxID=29729 RepID=A0A0B0PG68_GOSAR|nr:Cutinase gene palindrome-binding [Gossypium arboreum]
MLNLDMSEMPVSPTTETSSRDRMGKYVGASYVDARRKEFLNLIEGDRPVAEYEVEFLRLSRYARGMVVSEYEQYVCFDDSFRDNLRVLIALQRERDFSTLVKKAKIAERRTRVCLRCGSLDYRIRECPLRADQMQAQGMDWMVKRRVSLEYATKRVVLRTEEDNEVSGLRECFCINRDHVPEYTENEVSAKAKNRTIDAILACGRLYDNPYT